MTALQPRYSEEEFARPGDDIHERDIRLIVEKGNEGKYVAIDIESGDYEMDADEIAASDRLLARKTNAQIWLMLIGASTARRFGGRSLGR
jgi:hypothetical protein